MLVVLGTARLASPGGEVLHSERTFYGVHRITSDRANGRQRLFHGSTLHGEQSLDPRVRHEPLTYYHRTGPIGQMLGRLSEQLEHVGVIGLGAGSLAAYAVPGQQWTFFEIDPAVARIAANPRWFTYLSGCGTACTVVLGDARLSLAARDETYDLIVLDAFSSDAIPAHLLTREALALYLGRLSNLGVIAFHISNRHLDLRPAVASLTAERGLATRVQLHRPSNQSEAKTSLWIVAARSADALGPLAGDPRWEQLTTRSRRVWSDDYSDILSVLRPPA
jgi:spermidine synthase